MTRAEAERRVIEAAREIFTDGSRYLAIEHLRNTLTALDALPADDVSPPCSGVALAAAGGGPADGLRAEGAVPSGSSPPARPPTSI